MADCSKATGCRNCGKPLKGRRRIYCTNNCRYDYYANHKWSSARERARNRVRYYECEHCHEYFQKVEVNHIVPVRGKRNEWGCHHHQENLEVLCHDCHVAATRKQRAEGYFD